SEIKAWYACKSNHLSEVLEVLQGAGFGVDVASVAAHKQAQGVGVKRGELTATGPAKSRDYVAGLLQAQVACIVIESFNQLKDLNDLCGKLGLKQDVLLRVQLEWEGEKSILGGPAVTPFGLGLADWRNIDLGAFKNLNIMGLHCFQWGNVL